MDQPGEPPERTAMRRLDQKESGIVERDLRFPKLRCRDEVLKRANLTTEFPEYDASEAAGWTRFG